MLTIYIYKRLIPSLPTKAFISFVVFFLDFISTQREKKERMSQDAQLKAKFEELDSNHSGFLDRDELLTGVKAVYPSMTDAEIDELIKKVDVNKDGKLSYEEFCELIKIKKL